MGLPSLKNQSGPAAIGAVSRPVHLNRLLRAKCWHTLKNELQTFATDAIQTDFRDDVVRAKRVLEDTGGVEVLGYRAPSFSIGADNLWALDTLLRAGYRYSSSIYPVRHDHYGSPDAPRFAHEVRPGLLEVPPTTLRLFDRNLPSSGGGFFRLLPYPLSRWMLQQVNRRDGEAAVFYFHPWEIDPEQPRVNSAPLKSRA